MITTEEWDLLQNLVDVLEQFAEATDYLGVEDGLGLGLRNDLDGLNFEKRRPPGFEFHKGDALPKPGFQFGLLK
ncbi:unnamed protein product [Rhizophagus irregularis]|nr:unnamed protein product [Rhizophagus irregularis]